MDIDTLTLILAALSAFFTLITGAFAVAVTFILIYFAKLKKDREREISELISLQNSFEEKLSQIQNDPSADELKVLKKDFNKLRTSFARNLPVGGRTPTVDDLSVTVNDLLLQIAELQKQLAED